MDNEPHGGLFVRRRQQIARLWQNATTPTTSGLTRLSAWAQLIGLPFVVLGGLAAAAAVVITVWPPASQPPAPPALTATPKPASIATPALRVARLTVARDASYFVNPSEIDGTPGPSLQELEFTPLGDEDRDTWVPGPKWVNLHVCRSEKRTPAARSQCGDARRLRPVFDVLVEAETPIPAVVQSLRLVIEHAAFPQGSGPGPLGTGTVAIPRSAAYQISLHPDAMGAEDGRPRYTEIDLMPPLNVAQGTPARFSLAITSAELMQPTTMRCRIEVVTSAEQHFSSPSFTLFFP